MSCTKIKHPGGRPPKPASERATAVVHVRVTAARKAAYMAAAKSRNMPFSQWVQEWLDAGANPVVVYSESYQEQENTRYDANMFYAAFKEMRERMITEGLYTPPDSH